MKSKSRFKTGLTRYVSPKNAIRLSAFSKPVPKSVLPKPVPRQIDNLVRTVRVSIEKEELAKRQAEADRLAKIERDKRVREEERQALLKKVAGMSTADRAAYLEKDRIIAKGRELSKKIKNGEVGKAKKVDLALFGIDLDSD